jgi:Fic family protein
MRLMATAARSWVWRHVRWPDFSYDQRAVGGDLAQAYRQHGIMEGKAASIHLTSISEVALSAMAEEVVTTAAIEGEQFSMNTVRSSVKRLLGLEATGPTDRSVDGLVAVINDATAEPDQPLDADRLCRWHSALFPGGTSGIRRIAVGRFRDHEDPMQIVGGKIGREVVYYEAPPSKDVPAEMARFLDWFNETVPSKNGPPQLDALARAAIAHLWFESIHPFEDGNGRIGRAIVDMAVVQYLRTPVRLFSLSRQLLDSRSDYYDNLNACQRGGMDATQWVQWFVERCAAAYAKASSAIDQAMRKRDFLAQPGVADLNERQRKVLTRLIDDGDGGFLGGLNAEKYVKMTGISKPTSTRDLAEMVKSGFLWTTGEGKAIRYYVNVPGWTHGVASTAAAVPEPLAPSLLGGGHLLPASKQQSSSSASATVALQHRRSVKKS